MNIFVDEAGQLTDYTANGSKYFVIAAVKMDSLEPCNSLTHFRHGLEDEGFPLPKGFHAVNDPAKLRERVFSAISDLPIEVDYVALEKSKLFSQLRPRESHVYGLAVGILFKFLFEYRYDKSCAKRVFLPAYSAGQTKRHVNEACRDFINAAGLRSKTIASISTWETSTDIGLQIADYCAWIFQRKYEKGDEFSKRNYKKLDRIVKSEFFPF